jgi:hypothetical protein
MTHAVDDLSRRCPECGAHNRNDVDPCWLCGHVAAHQLDPAAAAQAEPTEASSSAPTAVRSEEIDSSSPSIGEDLARAGSSLQPMTLDGPPAEDQALVLPSFELLRYESGPPLTTAGRVILMVIVGLFVLVGMGLFLPLGPKMTVVYLLVAGIPAAFVMRLIWTRKR